MNYKHCDLRKGLEFILQDLINEEDKSYRTIENYQEKIVDCFDEKSDKDEVIKELKTDLEYAIAIIKDLLNNSHEYSRQNAEDFIGEINEI